MPRFLDFVLPACGGQTTLAMTILGECGQLGKSVRCEEQLRFEVVVEEEIGGEVGAELEELSFAGMQGGQGFCGDGASQRYVVVAGDFWRVEEEEAVDKAGGKGGGVETGAGFEEDVENFAAAEFLQDRIEVESALPARYAQKFNASVLQFASFGRLERSGGEDEEIVISGFDDARVRGETQARIENDAEERTTTRKATAVGEEGIVSEDGADAGEESVGGVAKAMNFGAGLFGGDPLTLFVFGGYGKSELAVERESGF